MQVVNRQKQVAYNAGKAAILDRAVELVHEVGPAAVHPNEICQELGLSKSLVNFHFQGRDGLLAEAIAIGYERYVDVLAAAVAAANDDPIARLEAWIDAQVAWTTAHVGLAAALNFPAEASSISSGYDELVQQQMEEQFTRNMALLRDLVIAARAVLRAGQPPAADEERDVWMDISAVGWMTLGMSVFSAGAHMPSANSGMRSFLPTAQAHAKAEILAMLAR